MGEGGVDVAVNFTGGDTMKDTQKCVKLRGRIVTCGATAGYELSIDARYWWTFEHSMIGSDGWSVDDLRELVDIEYGHPGTMISSMPTRGISSIRSRITVCGIIADAVWVPRQTADS